MPPQVPAISRSSDRSQRGVTSAEGFAPGATLRSGDVIRWRRDKRNGERAVLEWANQRYAKAIST